jgi:hypothetical protein
MYPLAKYAAAPPVPNAPATIKVVIHAPFIAFPPWNDIVDQHVPRGIQRCDSSFVIRRVSSVRESLRSSEWHHECPRKFVVMLLHQSQHRLRSAPHGHEPEKYSEVLG